MSTRNAVYKLQKELAFWQRVHEHEPMDEREFRIEKQIEQLKNCDQFGIPRYNGHIDDEDDGDDDEYTPQVICCRYCGKTGLQWEKVDGKWRLAESGVLHTCEAYRKHREAEVLKPQHATGCLGF